MRPIRRMDREAVDLAALLHLEAPDRPRIAARTVDLCPGGVGLLVNRTVSPGTPVSILIQDRSLGKQRSRRWRGQVVFQQSLDQAMRLGIAFDPGGQIPAVSFEGNVGRGRSRLRVDSLAGPAGPAEETGVSALFRSCAVGGMAADLALKALAMKLALLQDWAAQSSRDGRFLGLSTLLGLGAAGLACRLDRTEIMARRPMGRAGLGLMLSAVLGSLAGRLANVPPRGDAGWLETPAELLGLAGALATLASLASPARVPEAIQDDHPHDSFDLNPDKILD